MPDSDPRASRSLRWWEFEPRPRRPDREAQRAFDRRLRTALRAAHGADIEFAVVWNSGPQPPFRLGVRRAASPVRWAQELFRGYEQGQWSDTTSPRDGSAPGAIRWGRLLRGAERPLATGDDDEEFAESAAIALETVTPGVEVRWNFAPSALRAPLPPQPPPVEAARVPTGFRLGPLTDFERERRDLVARRDDSLVWGASVEVFVPAHGSAKTMDLATRAVATALRTEGSNAIAFVRPLRWWRRAAPRWWLGEAELARFLPGPYARVGRSGAGAAAGGATERLGRRPNGEWLTVETSATEGRHLAILGETGMGKSTLLLEIALRRAGEGTVLLFDPVGDIGRRFLGHLPAAWTDRVVWVSAQEGAVGLNALGGSRATAAPSDRAADDLVNALRRVRAARFAESAFWGPRIEEVLTRALRVAAQLPEGTLVEAHRLLERAARLGRGIPPAAQAEADALRERARERPDELEGARRLLWEIVGNPTLVRLLCTPKSQWSARELVADGRIVVLTGDAAEVGETTARYLLAVYLALAWPAILGRSRPGKLHLLLDEVQWYAHETLGELLRLGRRFNVHVALTTQSLASLGEPLRAAVLTNSADLVLFRGAPDEAREFARWVRGTSTEELLALPPGRAAALVGKGGRLDWIEVDLRRDAAAVSRGVPERHRDRALRWASPARAGGTVPTSPAPGPAGAPVHASVTSEPESDRLLECLREAPGPLVRVRWEALHTDTDDAPHARRRFGGWLGRQGWLAGSGRDEGGAYWVVRKEVALRELAATAAFAGEASPADVATPSGRPAGPREGF